MVGETLMANSTDDSFFNPYNDTMFNTNWNSKTVHRDLGDNIISDSAKLALGENPLGPPGEMVGDGFRNKHVTKYEDQVLGKSITAMK